MKKQSKGKTIIKIKATKKLNLNNKKSPEPQLIANNQLLGQPKSTPGPAFVQYKLNGKTIFSEAEEKAMKRGYGFANESNKKNQSETEITRDTQVNENIPFVGQPDAQQGPTLNTINREDPSNTSKNRDRRLENRTMMIAGTEPTKIEIEEMIAGTYPTKIEIK